jgi:hypothetical protein
VNARRVVVVLLLALAAYLALIGYRGIYLIGRHDVSLKVLGVAVLVLPLIGVWLVVAEVRFGQATQRLGERLDREGVPPEPDLPRMPSGRVDRGAADELFAARREDVLAAPEDWRAWYRLALAYDRAGDRRRARGAMRDAIERAEPPG